MGQVEEQEDPGLFGGGNLRGHLWVSRGGETERKVDKTDSVEGDPQEGRGEGKVVKGIELIPSSVHEDPPVVFQ